MFNFNTKQYNFNKKIKFILNSEKENYNKDNKNIDKKINNNNENKNEKKEERPRKTIIEIERNFKYGRFKYNFCEMFNQINCFKRKSKKK